MYHQPSQPTQILAFQFSNLTCQTSENRGSAREKWLKQHVRLSELWGLVVSSLGRQELTEAKPHSVVGARVQGAGLGMVQGAEFRARGAGCREHGFRARGLGCRVPGAERPSAVSVRVKVRSRVRVCVCERERERE